MRAAASESSGEGDNCMRNAYLRIGVAWAIAALAVACDDSGNTASDDLGLGGGLPMDAPDADEVDGGSSLDQGALPDLGVAPPPALACGDEAAIYDLNASGAVDEDGLWYLSGTTGGADWAGACSPAGLHTDAVVRFTAPAAGDWLLKTVHGTDLDTVVYVFTDCADAAATELACNDDAIGGHQSAVLVPLAVGQTVFIVVDAHQDPAPEESPAEQDFIIFARVADAPVVAEARLFVNTTVGSVGVTVRGTDADANVDWLSLVLRDAAGQEVGPLPMSGALDASFDWLEQDQGAFVGGFSLRGDFAAAVQSAEVVVVDADGLASAVAEAQVEVAPSVGEGAGCDIRRAYAACEADLLCVYGSCASADTEATCLPEWTVLALATDAPVAGRTGLGDQYAVGSCGGGGADAIYAFTAGEAGTYRFALSAVPDEAAPVLYVRSHCVVDDVLVELACNAEAPTALAVDLVAGQTVYVFVDGFEGTFTLSVTRG